MPYANISASLSDADARAIREALESIKAKLPFLVTLTPKERRSLVKMGEKSVPFVQQCLQAVKDNPSLMPPTFNVREFEADVNLASMLLPILLAAQDLVAKIDDTLLAIGSEAMRQSNDVYAQVKLNARRNPAMKATAEQLATRFKAISQGRRKKSASKS